MGRRSVRTWFLDLFDQRRDDFARQLVGGGHQKRLCSTTGFPGTAFEAEVSGVPKWMENLLGQVFLVEGDAVGGDGEFFDVVREMRAVTVQIGDGLEVGALFRGKGGKCLEFLHVEAEDPIEAHPIHTVTGNEDTGFFEPQAQRTHVFPAARDVDTAFLKPVPQLVEVDFLSGGVHVEHALDKVHSLAIHQDVPSKGFIQPGGVASKIVERPADLAERGVLLVDQTIGAQGQFRVVGELALVVVGSLMRGEISIADGVLESLPVGAMLVRQLQKDREVDPGRGKLAAEREVATPHRRLHSRAAVFGRRPGRVHRGPRIFTAATPAEFGDGVADEPGHGDPVFPGHGGDPVMLLLVRRDGKRTSAARPPPWCRRFAPARPA